MRMLCNLQIKTDSGIAVNIRTSQSAPSENTEGKVNYLTKTNNVFFPKNLIMGIIFIS